ncbi:MAG: 2-amino-4-hydroxy-6-hydroxymethyldihydropteridine diphosphokinase [Deltaproteobacteria bacterium]|jgi:2-amino-4-hydroxy-6-hydroxymethyldihydropteridine diphosphokinase|nr:2-amino-4-hydroxy-6-hydroxymethyldihydropteridine diphosphokinase [Deltaproteobacteria bacterium]MBW2531274.1 2-amino-4-hydroxy-6-hydroxymethyldihydropteridine diphosphokinase [Deltaproteobacteria bacterium]
MGADEVAATVWIVGLGSNLGDRLTHLRRAADALGRVDGIRERGRSRVFETAPVGGPDQPSYLNAAVTIATALPAATLLEHALGIERALGRARPDPVRWGPRTIDIDLLWADQLVVDQPGLRVPHPRLHVRPFALIPLLELAPDATDPTTGQRYADLEAARAELSAYGRL